MLDGAELHKLYVQRGRAETKKATREARAHNMPQTGSRKNKDKTFQRQKASVHFGEFEGSTVGDILEAESGCEMEGRVHLEAPVDLDSSYESLFMVSTPYLRCENLPRFPKLRSA